MSFEGFCTHDEILTVKTKFKKTFGSDSKSQIVVTPASLILLGDHTHYNEGLLLTAALNKYSIVQIRKRDDRQINITNTDSTNGIAKSFSLLDIQNVDGTKFKTLTCLIKLLHKERFISSGFDCVISTSIPECIGLGTTAALEIGFVTAIKKIFKLSIDIKELFLLVRKNELNILGKISNKAHFYNIKFVKEGKLLFVDLRTLDYKPVPIPNQSFNIVVCDTGERISNPENTCNERITECEVGVKGLRLYIWGIKNLRDVELEFLLRHVHMLPKKIFNRVLYNVKERIRAEQATKFLKNKSLGEFGKLITESHWSLTEDYEISCDKCDFIVRESNGIQGVYGSKMISCSPLRSTFHIVDKAHSHSFTEEIKKNYFEKFGEELKTYTFNLTSGLKELSQKEIQVTDI
jgi:galactokinase